MKKRTRGIHPEDSLLHLRTGTARRLVYRFICLGKEQYHLSSGQLDVQLVVAVRPVVLVSD